MNSEKKVVVGIDASRNRSGGAKAHIIGILSEGNPEIFGINEVHLWAYKELLNQIPDFPWLTKHNSAELEGGLVSQLAWQAFKLAKEAKGAGCQILFSTDASTLCRFSPMIVLSQDMLSYEPGVMKLFGFSKKRIRLLAILALQNFAFRFAKGVVFLTKYAGDVIQKSCGNLQNVAYIPHGVGENFKKKDHVKKWPNENREINCLYISNAAMYKHQWQVVSAISLLRKQGDNISITFVGGGEGKAQKLLDQKITELDFEGKYTEQKEFVPQNQLPEMIANTDIFIFASSCENMPVTLIEAMSVGLPIACSNKGPMPEVLEDGGTYFDPDDPQSIAVAISKIISNDEFRNNIARRAQQLSSQYSWKRCANETWKFITDNLAGI